MCNYERITVTYIHKSFVLAHKEAEEWERDSDSGATY